MIESDVTVAKSGLSLIRLYNSALIEARDAHGSMGSCSGTGAERSGSARKVGRTGGGVGAVASGWGGGSGRVAGGKSVGAGYQFGSVMRMRRRCARSGLHESG